MKSLISYINEWQLDDKSRKKIKKKKYKYTPKNKYELQKLTSKRYIDSSDIVLNDILTTDVEDMSYLFLDYHDLYSVDVNDWKTGNVKTFEGMFKGCENLTSIKGLENWTINKNANLKNMFKGCKDEIIPSWYDRNKWED